MSPAASLRSQSVCRRCGCSGLYLAVTTFALGLATEQWLLSDRFFGWFPKGDSRFERPPLFGRISLDTPDRYYMYSLARADAVVTWRRAASVVRGPGRVIVAVRENERAAQSYSIPAVRAKLTAFVISGVLAGIARCAVRAPQPVVQRHQLQHGRELQCVHVGRHRRPRFARRRRSSARSTCAASDGSSPSPEWQLLSSGAGVLLVLLILPGGLGALWVTVRDVMVRLLVRHRAASRPSRCLPLSGCPWRPAA